MTILQYNTIDLFDVDCPLSKWVPNGNNGQTKGHWWHWPLVRRKGGTCCSMFLHRDRRCLSGRRRRRGSPYRRSALYQSV